MNNLFKKTVLGEDGRKMNICLNAAWDGNEKPWRTRVGTGLRESSTENYVKIKRMRREPIFWVDHE